MQLEFDVKLTASGLYDFMLYHTYHGASGILGTVAGALFLVAFSMNHSFIYLVAGVVLITYIPYSLNMRAKKQALNGEFSKKTFHYVLSEQGIRVTQGEEEAELNWDQVYKVVASNRNIFVYTSKVNAWIFPKEILGEQKSAFLQLLSEYVDPSKMKVRQ